LYAKEEQVNRTTKRLANSLSIQVIQENNKKARNRIESDSEENAGDLEDERVEDDQLNLFKVLGGTIAETPIGMIMNKRASYF
jgi:hypothetical protein